METRADGQGHRRLALRQVIDITSGEIRAGGDRYFNRPARGLTEGPSQKGGPPARPDPPHGHTRRMDTLRKGIGIFIFDDVEELDWVGPWEVLRAWQLAHPDDGANVFTVAREPGTVTCAKGMRVLPDHSWASAPSIDVLIYPGGRGTRPQVGDEEIRGWVGSLAGNGALMTSVCTGSLVYADAGLLDGGPATTHWGALDLLKELGSGIEVRPDERFVDRGQVITAAGVSAGIDMALHLVARLQSVERARQIKRYIQYDPQPPV